MNKKIEVNSEIKEIKRLIVEHSKNQTRFINKIINKKLKY